MDSIKKLLEDEIASEFEVLGRCTELGNESYKATVDGLTKLIDRAIDIKKLEIDDRTKAENDKAEIRKLDLEEAKLKQTRKIEAAKLKQNSELEDAKLAQTREIETAKLKQTKDIELKKLTAIENDRVDQLIKNGIAIANIIIPSLITIWGTFKTLRFEETGTVTTIMGRGFVNKLIPKK